MALRRRCLRRNLGGWQIHGWIGKDNSGWRNRLRRRMGEEQGTWDRIWNWFEGCHKERKMGRRQTSEMARRMSTATLTEWCAQAQDWKQMRTDRIERDTREKREPSQPQHLSSDDLEYWHTLHAQSEMNRLTHSRRVDQQQLKGELEFELFN